MIAHRSKIYQSLLLTAERTPLTPAIIDQAGQVSYETLVQSVEQLIFSLQSKGLQAGMGVGLCVADGREFLVHLFALSALQVTILPIHSKLSSEERSEIVDRFHLPFIVESANGKTPYPELLQVSSSYQVRRTSHARSLPYVSHVDRAAFIRPTSGTTGTPKGVVLSEETVLIRIQTAQDSLQIVSGERVVWALPMAHHFVVSILLYVTVGATIVVDSEGSIIDRSKKYGGSFLYASPTEYQEALFTSDEQDAPTVRRAFSTGSSLPSSLAHEFEKKFHLPLLPLYGMIEVGLPLGKLAPEKSDPLSVGYPLKGFQVRIRHMSGRECEVTEVGELLLQGPGFFDGYIYPTCSRKEVLEDGWFPTGDLAYLNEDREVCIIGRKSNALFFRGQFLSPDEVEGKVNLFPGVRRSRASRSQLPTAGDEILQIEVEIASEIPDLYQYCEEVFPSAWKPFLLTQIEHIPLTATGKIRRTS